MPQLFLDLPVKTEEAEKSFHVLEACTYLKKSLGDSGQHEIMTCDCHEQWDESENRNVACGEDSGCINRVTSVECVGGKRNSLSCGEDCQNQRFQKKQYANVEVIQTEKKGYGVRAEEPISENQFIYEYIGEVIDEATFRKRMVEYDTNNFKHFYFMMLKKDSFIDATVKGSLARFCNHSCSPNAYVDKWVVGDKLKMGIFAKRAILQGEEITFDYNVDRYGAQSQPCYCGEPNCLKFMGGKTQTDLALLLPDGISESLGVTPQQEKAWLRENKHLRSKQQSDDSIINEAFVKSIEVQPLNNDFDVSKVMSALLKSQDKYIIEKLIERIHLTNDLAINSQIIRMHGYKALSQLIKQEIKDDELIIKILEILLKWPKVTKNKISSSQIEDVIKDLEKHTRNREVRELSSGLLNEWGNLQMAYRIPKNISNGRVDSESPIYGKRSRSPERKEVEEDGIESINIDEIALIVDVINSNNGQNNHNDYNNENYNKNNNNDNNNTNDNDDEILPEGWESNIDKNSGNIYYFHRGLGLSRWDKPSRALPKGPKIDPNGEIHNIEDRNSPKYKYSNGNGTNGGNGDKRSNGINGSRVPKTKTMSAKSLEGQIAKREEERLKRERQKQFKDLKEKDKLLQELIIQSQREADEKECLKKSLRRRNRKRKGKDKRGSIFINLNLLLQVLLLRRHPILLLLILRLHGQDCLPKMYQI